MKILKTVFAAFICLALSASICLSAFSLTSIGGLKEELEAQMGGYEDVPQEDDVVICGEYTIRSTKDISDAYISGDASKLDDRGKEALDMASAKLGELVTDNMSDFEKEDAIYEFLTTGLKPDTGILTVVPVISSETDNPYGVLKYGNAVCVGYATTFRLFMQMLGIECKVIHSSDLVHSWDLVKLDDEWYHVDCYMDSDRGNHMNFNMNDAMAQNMHTWTAEYFPAATGTKYNYAVRNSVDAESVFDMPKIISEHYNDGDYSFAIHFTTAFTRDDELCASNMVDMIYSRLVNSMIVSDMTSSWMKGDDGLYTLVVYIRPNNDEPSDSELDPELIERVNEAVNEYFEEYVEPYYYDDYIGGDYCDTAGAVG